MIFLPTQNPKFDTKTFPTTIALLKIIKFLLMQKKLKLKYFPISFFSVVMGLAGFAKASQKLEDIFKITHHFSTTVLYLSIILFIIITLCYSAKIILHYKKVRKEFNDPMRLSFFPTFTTSLILFSIGFLSINETIAKYLWIIGCTLHLILTIKIVSIWKQQKNFDIKHMTPAWFIPLTGNIIAPIVGVIFFPIDISWFFFSVGLILWIILLVIFFNRIFFHKPLSERLIPTLFILIAPPASCATSFIAIKGGITDFSRIMYYIALFFFLLLISQINIFYKIKYYLSWWAYSYPMSSITVASIMMFEQTGLPFFKYLSLAFFAILVFLIILLTTKTIFPLFQRKLYVES